MPSDPPSMPLYPQIHAEAMLEVFVHRSIRFPGVPLNTETAYGDADRLAILGGKILQLAYASVLFDQRPLLNAADLEVRPLPTTPNVDMYIHTETEFLHGCVVVHRRNSQSSTRTSTGG